MSQMSHCVLEVFIKSAGGLTKSKSDAPALEVRGLGNQTGRHCESAELRDAFPGLDTMQHHDLRESERPTKGQVSLPDDGRLFVSYSPPVCTFNSVLKNGCSGTHWYYVEMRDRHRTGELPSSSEDSYGDAKVWRFPLTFVLAPLPVASSLLRFLARRRRKQRSPEVRLGDVRLVHAHNIAFVEVEFIGVTVYVRQLGKVKGMSFAPGILAWTWCVAGRSWSVMNAVRRRIESACRLEEPVS